MEKDQKNSYDSALNDALKEEGIAFSDVNVLKNSMSTEEFESILKYLRSSYKKVVKVLDKRKDAINRAKESILQMKEQGAPDSFISKATIEAKSLIYEADEAIYDRYKKELKSIHHIVSFINAFSLPENKIETPDVSFIKRLKKK